MFLALVLGAGGWLVLNSPIFAVRHIRVVGNLTLTSDEVIARAGVDTGDNLFHLAPRDMEEALQRSPWVAEADVLREWPSTLVLRITERRPAGWARVPGGDRALVAADGIVLATVPGNTGGLPSLGSLEVPGIPGAVYGGPAAVIAVAASFSPELRREVAAIRVGKDGVTLRLRMGGRVLYGSASSREAKNTALVSILRQARKDSLAIDYVDLRIPSAPALKPAAPAAQPTG